MRQRITKGYETRVAELPPEQRKSAPKLEDLIKQGRQLYLRQRPLYLDRRSHTAWYEWFVTVLALVGTAATAAAAGSIRPTAGGQFERKPPDAKAKTR